MYSIVYKLYLPLVYIVIKHNRAYFFLSYTHTQRFRMPRNALQFKYGWSGFECGPFKYIPVCVLGHPAWWQFRRGTCRGRCTAPRKPPGKQSWLAPCKWTQLCNDAIVDLLLLFLFVLKLFSVVWFLSCYFYLDAQTVFSSLILIQLGRWEGMRTRHR